MNAATATFARRIAALVILGSAAAGAHAQSSCSISTTPLNFGAYTGAQVQVTGTVSLTCTGPIGSRANYSITASPGNSNNYAQRFMARTAPPADSLNYSLAILLGAGYVPWGNGSGGTSAWTGRTARITLANPVRVTTTTIRGTILAGPVPAAGTYNDTITVTATWN